MESTVGWGGPFETPNAAAGESSRVACHFPRDVLVRRAVRRALQLVHTVCDAVRIHDSSGLAVAFWLLCKNVR